MNLELIERILVIIGFVCSFLFMIVINKEITLLKKIIDNQDSEIRKIINTYHN